MPSESERMLIQQIRTPGTHAAAWYELVEQYEGRVRAYIRKRLNDDANTDDALQETFIGFLNSLANYDDSRNLQSWLFTIASHKVTDHLRKQGRKQYAAGSDSNEEQLGKQSDDRQRRASSIARSKERIEWEANALVRVLRDLIQGLMKKGEYLRVQVLELIFVKGWANQEVAKFLQLTEQQVANYRFAAVKKITETIRIADLPSDLFPELHE